MRSPVRCLSSKARDVQMSDARVSPTVSHHISKQVRQWPAVNEWGRTISDANAVLGGQANIALAVCILLDKAHQCYRLCTDSHAQQNGHRASHDAHRNRVDACDDAHLFVALML